MNNLNHQKLLLKNYLGFNYYNLLLVFGVKCSFIGAVSTIANPIGT